MKKITLLSLLIVLLSACGEKQVMVDNSVSGNITNMNEGDKIYLDYLTPQQLYTKDSATIDENGNYSFAYKVETLGYYRLRINNLNFVNLVLDVGETPVLNGDGNNLMDTYTVEGSIETNRFIKFQKAYKLNTWQQDSIGRVYQANPNDQSLFIQLQQAKFGAIAKMNNTYTTLINENPGSLVSLAAVQQLDPKASPDLYEKVDEALAQTMKDNPWFTDFHRKVESMVNLFVGDPAPEFTLNNIDGNPVALSSLKGKIVLIDFWASWCKPCRAENPNVVKAYNKYKSKGFDVMSVSLDKDKNRWLAAIEQDNLSWKNHVSDLKAWGSVVVPMYGIEGIPFTLLIDKDGIILGKNLRGEDLEKKLAEVFN